MLQNPLIITFMLQMYLPASGYTMIDSASRPWSSSPEFKPWQHALTYIVLYYYCYLLPWSELSFTVMLYRTKSMQALSSKFASDQKFKKKKKKRLCSHEEHCRTAVPFSSSKQLFCTRLGPLPVWHAFGQPSCWTELREHQYPSEDHFYRSPFTVWPEIAHI